MTDKRKDVEFYKKWVAFMLNTFEDNQKNALAYRIKVCQFLLINLLVMLARLLDDNRAKFLHLNCYFE